MGSMDIYALAARNPRERRAALTPDSVKHLREAGHSVTVESGGGLGAGFADGDYSAAGARVGGDLETDLVVCIEPPDVDDVAGSSAVLGLLEPLDDPPHLQKLAGTGATCFAFELVPRTTRAQAVDALSSQATLAGYQAVLEGAALCDRILPMMTTAAGTLRPARVLVLGAGVAGLQAIATARRLGAVVTGFDVRKAAAEQVESLGADFLAVDVKGQDAAATGGYARELEDDDEARLLEQLFEHVTGSDLVITTAAIPGRPAPLLVTAGMVARMRRGAVVVDGSAASGGNCEVSRAGQIVDVGGVTVTAPLDLVSRSANHASQLYSRNITNFIALLTGENGQARFDSDDELVVGSTAARDGEIVHPRVLQSMAGA